MGAARLLVLLYCCVTWLHWGISQSITAEQFRLLVESRVNALSLVANNAYINLTEEAYQSCPYGNQLYDTCNEEIRPANLSFSDQFMREVSTSASSIYFRGFLAGYAQQFTMINDYQQLEIVFDQLCMSEALSDSWILIGNNDVEGSGVGNVDGLLWHFYGDEVTGFVRNYPYFSHDVTSDLCLLRQLDPRFRPWFVSTATSSKAVYMLIHSTSFDLLPLMRQAAIRLVQTLAHNDFIYVILTNSNNFNDNFLPANESIRLQIKDFINTATSSSITPTLNIGTTMANAIRSLNNQTACHRAIVLLTDASLDQSILDTVTMENRQQPYSVDIYTLTVGIRADDTYAGQLSCDNGGDSFVITSDFDVEEAIAGYYRFYAALQSLEPQVNVSWTEVYSDFFLETEVLSACLPVRNVAMGQLLGVTCVDVNATYLQSLSNGSQVLAALSSPSPVITCPSRNVTDDIRAAIRSYRFCNTQANLSTPDQVTSFYEQGVRDAIDLVIAAEMDVTGLVNSLSQQAIGCPYRASVYDACTDDFLPYTFNPSLSLNTTNISSNVILSPSAQDQLEGFSLMDYTSDKPLFESLCYTSSLERLWHRQLALNPQEALQFYASQDGFLRVFPAIRLNQCDSPAYDPRTRPFYATTASGRKDVVIVMDITTSEALPVAMATARDLLNTLSALDYFIIINSTLGNDNVLAIANQTNRVQAATLVSSFVTTDAKQHFTIATAFDVITKSRDANITADCQLAIIIITDRPITMETVGIVTNGMMSTGPANLFVTSLVNEPVGYYDNLAVQLTCNYSGIWNKVGYSSFTTDAVVSYYQVLAQSVVVSQPVWSEVYDDYTGMGEVVTVCQPHYDETVNIGNLLGVACADVTLAMLENAGADRDFINSLVDQQTLLPCVVFPLTVNELEPLRPDDAKCLSPPPVISVPVSTPTSSIEATTIEAMSTVTLGTVLTMSVEATSTMTASTTGRPTSTSRSTRSDSGLSAGGVVGIIVACVVILTMLLTVVIGWYYCRNIRGYQKSYEYRRTKGTDNDDVMLSTALVSHTEANGYKDGEQL